MDDGVEVNPGMKERAGLIIDEVRKQRNTKRSTGIFHLFHSVTNKGDIKTRKDI